MRRYAHLLLLPLLLPLAGCPVTQSQDTPVQARRLTEPRTGGGYWLYVPSTYRRDRDWPLVITLHGTHPWDDSRRQVAEWKALAEEEGFLVAAPDLRSTQGILPVVPAWWRADLRRDERRVLAVLEELGTKYRIDRRQVLLTGFSSGGYPLYYTGLRHPERFDMLVARACNNEPALFEGVQVDETLRNLPVMIFWGKDDLGIIQKDSWAAFRWLREHRCFQTEMDEITGGHLRRPKLAWDLWRQSRRERGLE